MSVALRHRLGLIACVLVALVAAPLEAQQRAYSADEVKAAFLYRFGTYVDWPNDAEPARSITIAVLGAPQVATQLAAYLPGRAIQGRPVAVRPIERIEDAGGAQVLFIGREHSAMLTELIAAVGRRPILTVTDAADGLEHGAMVNFQLVDQRLRFEISLRRAQDAGLMLSSRLLSAAIRVVTSGCWPDCREAPSTEELAVFRPQTLPGA